MITLTTANDQSDYWTDVYEASFPPAERMLPAKLFALSADRQSRACAAVLKEGTERIGIVYYVTNTAQDKAFILYLAIDPAKRGGGLGSQAIATLTTQFPQGIILESELIDEHADNALDRQRRYDFYLRNELEDSGFTSDTLGGVFHLLRSARQVTLDDYFAFLGVMGLRARVTTQDEG